MYDELVKRLREHNGWALNETLDEAADAIEELTRENKELSFRSAQLEAMNDALIGETGAADALMVVSQPRWIPVSERLPESGERVLACCRVKWLGGGGRTYVCAAFHSAPKTETCVFSDDIDMEYDEETDEYYLPEGWWEVINNWDDYSFVAIGDFVTHWMPLTPPEEG